MNAGAGGTNYGVLTSTNQGGGNKKQGLVTTTNTPVELVSHTRVRGGGHNRNLVFCMNQLGGVGRRWGQASGPGNRGGVSLACQAMGRWSRIHNPPKPCGAQVRGWGSGVKFPPICEGGAASPAPPTLNFAGFVYASAAAPTTGKWLTPLDVVRSEYIDETVDQFKTSGRCDPWRPGTATYPTASEPHKAVSQLEFVRAWKAAGNTDWTAKYGLIVAGGEAGALRGDPIGTYANDLTTVGGILQCDTCGAPPYNMDNLNICETIWAATRIVMIPQLSQAAFQAAPVSTGCILMEKKADGTLDPNTNVCNTPGLATLPPQCYGVNNTKPSKNYNPDGFPEVTGNWIGPFCHVSNKVGEGGKAGYAWSDENNFPNNYYHKYITSMLNGAYFGLKGTTCYGGDPPTPASPPCSPPPPCPYPSTGKFPLKDTTACVTADMGFGTGTCCGYDGRTPAVVAGATSDRETYPVTTGLAGKIAKCGLENKALTSILDCPAGEQGKDGINQYFDTNICNVSSGCQCNCFDCYKLKDNAFLEWTDPVTTNPTDTDWPRHAAAAGLCYGGNVISGLPAYDPACT